MPYFIWTGVDVSGSIRKGKRFARTVELLDAQLLREEIDLLSCSTSLWRRVAPLSMYVQGQLAERLASLLEKGIRLADAFEIVSKTITMPLARDIALDCAQGIRQGLSISQVLQAHEALIDRIFIALVMAGQEASALPKVLRILSNYCALRQELTQKLKSSLLTPCITFIFFLLSLYGLFYWIIPRFESLFVLMRGPLPSATAALFKVSRIMRVKTNISCLLIGIIGIGALFKRGIAMLDILSVPCIKKWFLIYYMTFFFRSLALLLEGEVHLTKALSLTRRGIPHVKIQSALEDIEKEVEAGGSFGSALSKNRVLGADEAGMLCQLGETMGALAPMVSKAAELYEKRLYALLSFIAFVVPSLVLIVLGCMIGFFIMAVYAPLLTLAQNIGP